MPRIRPVDPDSASPETRALLDAVRAQMGTVPGILATMAHAPAATRAYLGFTKALASGALPARLREQIALVVGETNGCAYCVAAHTALGKGTGLTEQETLDARRGDAEDPRERAALEFAKRVVTRRAAVRDADVAAVREAGFTDGEIVEILAHVALNLLTNYVNHVAGTAVDFPAPPALAA